MICAAQAAQTAQAAQAAQAVQVSQAALYRATQATQRLPESAIASLCHLKPRPAQGHAKWPGARAIQPGRCKSEVPKKIFGSL